MKTQIPTKVNWVLIIFLLQLNLLTAQVGINTTSPANGALLDISSSSKGFLMPRVALTDNLDNTTITPSATIGLLLYNTATAGSGSTQVTPGFYYWNGSSWRRLFNQGYVLNYKQSAEVQASTSNTTYVDLPGLDTGTFSVPFSGTYQIVVHGAFAAGDRVSGSTDGAAQGSISLHQSTNGGAYTNLKETYVTSSSKIINGTTVNNLAQSVTIVVNLDLDVTETYQFKVRGREWLTNNVGTGWFGKDTSGYSGSGSVNDAQRGTMSISLIRQY